MNAFTKPIRAVAVLHLLGALSFSGWLVLACFSKETRPHLTVYLGVTAWTWLAFVTALVLVRKAPHESASKTVLLWSVAFRLAGFAASPMMEDDYFRFLWDGRQFALTGNPYATAPAEHFTDEKVAEPFREILDQINYPHLPTIYGPVCQAGFALSYWMAPGALWPWKLLIVCADLVALVLVWRLAAVHGCAPGEASAPGALAVLIFGWCPLAVFETSFNAHPDILGVALLIAALAWWRSRAVYACAIFCSLAVAAKLFALLVPPFLLGRNWRAWGVFAGVLGVCYAPFWLQGSPADLSGLSAFAAEWEFNSSILAVARWILGPASARLLCSVLFVLIWGALLFRWLAARPGEQTRTLPPGTILYGSLLLLSATVNPWYLLWMLPFVALRPNWVGLTALAAVSLSYITGLNLGDPALDNFAHPKWVRPVEYSLVVVAGVGTAWLNRRGRLPGK